ncbi:MAG: porin [Cytophagaceae bacterium]|nr:porin [Cytophagaceae bacterium]MBK9936384.1 porin [Cytophagaceae bacterium]MBL0300132.1 porin [Cytophagaceae bacterium]MBL0327069.1 porin [Cytophagaceae bacterium]
MKRVFFTFLGASISLAALATEDPTKPNKTEKKVEKTEEVKVVVEEPKNPLSFSGYVDTYYFANFNGVQSNLGASGFERIFDQKANNFQVGLAQFKTTYTTDKVTGVIDLTFGNHGDLGNYGNTMSPLGEGIGTTGLAIKQAYISWKMGSKATLTGGQYGTNVGYEVIDAPVNFNYSLSNLFGNGPFYHTGIKLDIAATDKLGLMVGLVNGLDSKDDNNKSKGIQAQISIKPIDKWSVYLNYFGSDEGGEKKDMYSWFDLTTSMQATDKLLVGLNAAYGKNSIGSWAGAALYLNGSVSEKFSLGTRIEYFDNSKGGIYLVDENGDGVSTTGITLTGSYKVSDNLMFKPEYRFDSYKNEKGTSQLFDKDGKLTKKSQSTLGAALIFYF